MTTLRCSRARLGRASGVRARACRSAPRRVLAPAARAAPWEESTRVRRSSSAGARARERDDVPSAREADRCSMAAAARRSARSLDGRASRNDSLSGRRSIGSTRATASAQLQRRFVQSWDARTRASAARHRGLRRGRRARISHGSPRRTAPLVETPGFGERRRASRRRCTSRRCLRRSEQVVSRRSSCSAARHRPRARVRIRRPSSRCPPA